MTRLALLLVALCAQTASADGGPYEEMSLNQFNNPTGKQDVDDRDIAVVVKYMGTYPEKSFHLPKQYRKGYICLMVQPDGGGAMSTNIVVPEEQADAVFALKVGAKLKLSGHVDVFGRANVGAAVTGVGMSTRASNRVLIVDLIEAADASEASGPADGEQLPPEVEAAMKEQGLQ